MRLVAVVERRLGVRRWVRQRRARAGCSASPRRSAKGHGPFADSPVLLGLVARRQTHCAHCVRCVQTGGDKSVHVARCARGPRALRCSAPQALRSLPGRAFAATVEVFAANTNPRGLRGRRCPAGAIWVATSSAGPGSARAQRALRELTRRGCLNAVSAANEVSSATGRETEHRRGVGAQHRPPPSRAVACPRPALLR